HGVVATRSMRTGGMALDEAIIRYIRNEKGLVIGQRTAEDLKIDIGSAKDMGPESAHDVLLRGRDARTGKPSTVSVSPREVYRAILQPLQVLLENIREAFENTPPELAADILERGIYLSGGGARLEGLSDRLSGMLKLPVHMGEAPEDDVAAGAGAVASDEKLAAKLLQTGCLIEL
ncbi:MAG: rod shape-determining protein, partial [Clostridiales bacterium]|nr:rod shape-determining protein [Clostridiales bacterium]